MKHTTRGALRGLIPAILGILTIPLLPLVAAFARKQGFRRTTYSLDLLGVERFTTYDARALPRWLYWFDTPDQWLPGGLYEPTVVKWYERFGWYGCTVLWLLRNRMYGLTHALGHPASIYDRTEKRQAWVGKFLIEWGWERHYASRDPSGEYWLLPEFSIKSPKAAAE